MPSKGRHWRTDVKTMEQWDKEGLIEWSSAGNPRKIIFSVLYSVKSEYEFMDIEKTAENL